MKKNTKQQIIQIMNNELIFTISNSLPDKFKVKPKINDTTLAHLRKICESIITIVFAAESDEDACLSVCDYLMDSYNSFNKKALKSLDDAKWISAPAMKYSTDYYSSIVFLFIKTLLDIYIGRKEAKH